MMKALTFKGLAGCLRLRGLVWLGVSLVLLPGCFSDPEKEPEEPVGPTHYTLETGKRQTHPDPLPDEVPILVKWHQADGTVKTVEGYRGWDFDGDERFEMVQVLDSSGEVETWIYDFDADGDIDAIRGVQGKPLPPGMSK